MYSEKTNSDIERPMSTKEASVYLGVSLSTLYKYIHNRAIPCYKPMGRLVYFKKDELDNWIYSQRQKTDDELQAEAETFLVTQKKRG